MKITPEQVCEALDAWVCRPGMTQEQATILITEAFWALKERPNIDVQRVTFNDGEVDQRALGVIQLLHQKCSFANYLVKNDGQRHALSQAKSIAEEMMTGCTNFVFSGKPGTGKNHLAAAIGNHLLAKGRSVIVVTVADVMLALHGNYDNKNSGEKFLQGLCEVDLLVLDEIGMQRDTRNEQVTLNQIVDRRTASMHSVGMLTNLNHTAMNTLLGERVMDRMTMNGGRWVNFNWESWRTNVIQPGIEK